MCWITPTPNNQFNGEAGGDWRLETGELGELARGRVGQGPGNYSLPARHVGQLAAPDFYIPLVISHSLHLHPLSRLAGQGRMPTWQKEMSYCISDLIYVSDRLTGTFLLAAPRSGPDNAEKLV